MINLEYDNGSVLIVFYEINSPLQAVAKVKSRATYTLNIPSKLDLRSHRHITHFKCLMPSILEFISSQFPSVVGSEYLFENAAPPLHIRVILLKAVS